MEKPLKLKPPKLLAFANDPGCLHSPTPFTLLFSFIFQLFLGNSAFTCMSFQYFYMVQQPDTGGCKVYKMELNGGGER